MLGQEEDKKAYASLRKKGHGIDRDQVCYLKGNKWRVCVHQVKEENKKLRVPCSQWLRMAPKVTVRDRGHAAPLTPEAGKSTSLSQRDPDTPLNLHRSISKRLGSPIPVLEVSQHNYIQTLIHEILNLSHR